MYWKIRSREDWLKWGDKNTKWFHSRATHKKRKNEIKGLLNDYDLWLEEEEDISSIANAYFLKLFDSSDPNIEEISKIANVIDKRLTKEQVTLMDGDFTKEEIEMTLKSMNPTKAPGS